MEPCTHKQTFAPVPIFEAGLKCPPWDAFVPVPNSNYFQNRLPSHFNSQGSHYNPLTQETRFLVAVSSTAHAVELVIRDRLSNGGTVIPLHQHGQDTNLFGTCLKGVSPGTLYAYRLKDENGNVLSLHCADPWALAETTAAWKPHYIERVRNAMNHLRKEGESDEQIIQRLYSNGIHHPPDHQDRRSFLDLLGRQFNPPEFSPPWSIVIDRSQLLPLEQIQIAQPHGMGSRVICKYHPLHSEGVPDEFISSDFRQHRGKIDILLDPKFRSYIKRYWNTIEFFPLTPSLTSPELKAMGRTNVWGYMPTQLFALNPDYFSSSDPHQQIRTLQLVVKTLKEDGISVIADLVPFHTAETGTSAHFGLRALDQRYYLLNSGGTDIDLSGCQNTLNINNPDVQRLILAQSRHFISMFGLDRRIDQGALAHTPKEDPYGFDPNHPFARELFELGPCIVELAVPHGLFFRQGQSLSGSPNVFAKDFGHRQFLDSEAYGATHDPWGVRMVGSRAFLQAGSVGGPHPIQRDTPLGLNKGVSVLPHDGLTPFDRSEIGAAILTAKTSGDAELLEIADQIRRTPSWDQFRYVLIGSLLEKLRERCPDRLFDFRSAIAKRALGRHYLLPGAILTVFGDQVCRTQKGNPDAYDRADLLINAATPAEPGTQLAHAQDETEALIRSLFAVRKRYGFYFSNINIINEFPSSADSTLIPTLSWHDKAGSPLEQRHWEKGVGSVRGFLGIQVSGIVVRGASCEAPPKLYIGDSHLPRNISLPSLPEGRSWRLIIDSCDPLKKREQPAALVGGSTFRFEMPGIAVFEEISV